VLTSLLLADLAPCLHEGRFGGCLVLSGGVQRGRGEGFREAQEIATPYAAAGIRGLVEVPVVSRLSVRGQLDLLAPLVHTVFLIDREPVFRTPTLTVAVGLSLAWTAE
jgi:hypothetical protein